MVYIIKFNGEKEEFSRDKAFNSCLKAGASPETAREIVGTLSKIIKDGTTTKQIKDIIYKELHKREKTAAIRYNLKEAISHLNSEIREFELYTTKLFTYLGYKTQWSPIPKPHGACVDHELDVVLEKDQKKSFIECKHHFNDHRFNGLDVVMIAWAALDDLQQGYKQKKKNSFWFEEAWLVTNTKFSEHAIRYAQCKKLNLLGWNFPYGQGIETYIEKHKAYPLSIIPLSVYEREKLLQHDVFDVNDLFLAQEQTLKQAGLSAERIMKIKKIVMDLLKNHSIKT